MQKRVLLTISAGFLIVFFATVSVPEGFAEKILLEDWNMPDNSAGWWQPNGYVSENMLRITNNSAVDLKERKKVFLPSDYSGSDFIQADLMLHDGVFTNEIRVSAEVGGCFGNYKYTSEEGYSGIDGNINMTARVEKRNTHNTFRLVCAADRINNPTGTDSTEFFWKVEPLPPNQDDSTILPDTMYTATLEKKGTVLSCEIKNSATGETLLEYSQDVTTVAGVSFISEVGESKSLRVRLLHDAGSATGYFDNLYVSPGSASFTTMYTPVLNSIIAKMKDE